MQEVRVPSGQKVQLMEMLEEAGQDGPTRRYRFVAPGLGEIAFEDAARDMDHLCAEFGVREAADAELALHRVIVSLSEQPIAFGATDASITQYFEVYSVEGGQCHIELF